MSAFCCLVVFHLLTHGSVPHIAPVGYLSWVALNEVTNPLAGTASLEVGEEEGGRYQPGSLNVVVSFLSLALDYLYFCTSFAFDIYYNRIYHRACDV